MRHLRYNGAGIPTGLPSVTAYLRDTVDPPPGVDHARLRRVRAFFQDDGMQISALLAIGALIGCYAVPHGAQLLSMTHRLDRPQQRLAESGTFTLYMMDEHALEAGGQFIPAVQKVRADPCPRALPLSRRTGNGPHTTACPFARKICSAR